MAIHVNEVKEMDKMTVNYLELYKNYIKGYKQYKQEKAQLEAKFGSSQKISVQ
jgi:hypothetical protein